MSCIVRSDQAAVGEILCFLSAPSLVVAAGSWSRFTQSCECQGLPEAGLGNSCLIVILQSLPPSFLLAGVDGYTPGHAGPAHISCLFCLCLSYTLSLWMRSISLASLGHIKLESFQALQMPPGPLPATGWTWSHCHHSGQRERCWENEPSKWAGRSITSNNILL